jgi:hypothetical protein
MATASGKAPMREENNQMSGRGKKAQETILGPAVGHAKGNSGASGGINRATAGKGAAR